MYRILRAGSRTLNTSDWKRNVVSSSVFGDFQFKSKEKSEIKSSYDVVIVGAGACCLTKLIVKPNSYCKIFPII